MFLVCAVRAVVFRGSVVPWRGVAVVVLCMCVCTQAYTNDVAVHVLLASSTKPPVHDQEKKRDIHSSLLDPTVTASKPYLITSLYFFS